MDEEPFVSIIMATLNRAHLLPRAIKSVLNQTYTNFELIIIDDNSSDGTKEVIESFNDPRIIYHNRIKSDVIIGSSFISARNCGFDMAKGEIIAKLDDDDELLPHALETAVFEFARLDELSINIIWFVSINAESGKYAGRHWDCECVVSYKDLLCEKFQGDYWVVIKKTALGVNRLDERLWTGQGILWKKIHRSHKGYFIPKILYKQYRHHGIRMTNANSLNHLTRSIFTQKYYLDEFGRDLKRYCSDIYWKKVKSLGINQILDNQLSEGRKNLITSLKHQFSIKGFSFYITQFFLPRVTLIALYNYIINITLKTSK